MAYELQNFKSGEILTATALNKLDEQVRQNSSNLEELLSKEYATVEQLNAKQDLGNYVTSESLTEALNSKQDSGNYVTLDEYQTKISELEARIASLEERLSASQPSEEEGTEDEGVE